MNMRKIVAFAAAVVMLLSAVPFSAFAADIEFDVAASGCDYYKVITKNDYALAPGAVESEIVINNDDGTARNVVHVIEVDLTNPNISVMPANKNISETTDYSDEANWGILGVTEHAAYAEEELGLNVVGGMNVSLSWDFTHPYGLLIYNGVVLADTRSSCEYCGGTAKHPGGGYLVITKDGKAELRDPLDPLTGDEWMAQTVCFSYIVKDGVSKHTTPNHADDSSAAPRSVIGIKEDGTLVLMMVDGRMLPYSKGMQNHEMAETMLALGCVDAINCDGGGSSTFITEREGTGELTMKSRPSDGSERSTISGILVISKAVADGQFDHAAVQSTEEYVTPGSSVTFNATGADSAGGPADIPADVSWQLADPSMGTVENGVFTSNGTVGTATVQMVYNGEVVGEDSVEVVIPESISFAQANITAPYSKSVALDIVAKYGLNEVTLKDGDIAYALSDSAMGTLSGNVFTATSDESVSAGTVTATLTHNEEVTAVANITLGKASEIVYDFESGADSIANISLSYKTPYLPESYNFLDTLDVVTVADGGKVKNGDYALRVTSEGDSITCMNWCQTRIDGWNIDLTDAISLSFWMYIPEGSHGLEWDFGNAIPVNLGHEFVYGTGWQYFTVNVSDIGTNVTNLNQIRLYHSDTNCASTGYNHYEHPNYYTDVVYYIDDITVNYSTAVEDFDPPVISDVLITHDNTDNGIEMTGQTIAENVVAITAKAADSMDKTNYTGLDTTSVKVFVDGVQVDATCTDNGFISTADMELANGAHIFRVEAADNRGNVSYVEKSIVIEAENNAKNTIQYAPVDATLVDLLADSLFWHQLTATAIDQVQKVEMIIDLDNNSEWELDHMILADGFTATYSVDSKTNDATIVIERTGDVTATGEAVLAKLPVRVWSPTFANINEDAYAYRLVATESYMQMGLLTEADGTTAAFGSAKYSNVTEFNSTRLTSSTKMESWHAHTVEAVEDVAATCSQDGYTGRTYCAVCDSIVDWGTTVAATGVHTYEDVDGKLTCTSGGELLNGVHTDGKTYVDGVVMADGWNGESYYQDGVLLTGVQLIDGLYYNFGTDGICANKYPMSAEWWTNENGESRYLNAGVPLTDYQYIANVPTYFDEQGIALQGEIVISGETCVFEKGAFVESTTADVLLAGMAGPKAYFILYADGTFVLSGEGATYDYLQQGLAMGDIAKRSFRNRPWGTGSDSYAPKIKNIVVGAGITTLGERTFNLCNNVKTVTFEEGSCLTHIKVGALNGSYVLKEIRIPETVTHLGYTALGGCTALVDVYMPEKIVDIHASAFNVSDKVVLHVYEGTSAERFAVNNGLAYVYIEKEVIVKNGFYEEDGELYYYENGEKWTQRGVFKVGDDFYYAMTGGALVRNSRIWASVTNDLVPYDIYSFDADGKMEIKNGFVEEDGELYYYVDGVKWTRRGVFQVGDDFYYAMTGGALVRNSRIWASVTNDLVPYDIYNFDADGKMEIKNGFIEEDGELYYYVNGVKWTRRGVFQVGDDFYYAMTGGALVRNSRIWASVTNDLVPYDIYNFDADGKMEIKNGFVEEDGELYYYVAGVKWTQRGVFQVGDDFYYAKTGGALVRDSRIWASVTNDLVPYDIYTFDANGKMIIE